MHKVIFPELGEGIEKAKIACWHIAVGDRVAKDDDLVELVTDKATFNVPAEVPGIVQEICAHEGQEVGLGQVLAVLKPSIG
ncbi:MAG TPA: lipoyl domain-containing protein [Candidatus Omnitrophota bacterium]|nr:lipoyl domain-containing protein [Candidatus Omnitrophota bacterium]